MIYNSTEKDGLDWCNLAHSLLIRYKDLEKRNDLDKKVNNTIYLYSIHQVNYWLDAYCIQRF